MTIKQEALDFINQFKNFAKHQKEFFKNNKNKVIDSNSNTLFVSSFLMFVIFIALFVMSFFSPDYFVLRYEYLTMVVILGSLVAITLFCHSNRFSIIGSYFFGILLVAYNEYISVLIVPSMPSTGLIVALCFFPILVLDESLRIDLIQICMTTVCIVLSLLYKKCSQIVIYDEIANSVSFCIIGMIIGSYFRFIRLNNYELRRKSDADSKIDFLTQLKNRRYMFEVIKEKEDDCKENEAVSGTIMLDIDFFKKYNDTHGHQAGDEILEKIASTLKTFEKSDGVEVFRYGGEEFVAFCYTNSEQDLAKIAEGMRKAVYDLDVPFDEYKLSRITISAGVAFLRTADVGNDVEKLINASDKALYLAKNNGKNRVEIYKPDTQFIMED